MSSESSVHCTRVIAMGSGQSPVSSRVQQTHNCAEHHPGCGVSPRVYRPLPFWCGGAPSLFGVVAPPPFLVWWRPLPFWCGGAPSLFGVVAPPPFLVWWRPLPFWCGGAPSLFGVVAPPPFLVWWRPLPFWCGGAPPFWFGGKKKRTKN